MVPESSLDSRNAPLPEIAHVRDESKVSDACFRWVREYKKLVPDLSLDAAIATLSHQLQEARLPQDICDVHISTLIARFDSIEPYDALERARLLYEQIETSDVHLPSHLSHLPKSTVDIYRELAAFVACLQVINNGPAPCSCRVAGDFLGISHEMANRHLAAMEKLGIITRTKNHTRKMAREYIIADDIELPDTLIVDTTTHNSTTHNSPPTNRPSTEVAGNNPNATICEVAEVRHDSVAGGRESTPPPNLANTGNVIPFAGTIMPNPSGQHITPAVPTDKLEVTCDGCKHKKVWVTSTPSPNTAILCKDCEDLLSTKSKSPKEKLLHVYHSAIKNGNTNQEAHLRLAHAVSKALNTTTHSTIEHLLNWFEAFTPNAVVEEVVEVISDKNVRNCFAVLKSRCENMAVKKGGAA